MARVQLDPAFVGHPKLLALSAEAGWVWVRALAVAVAAGSDGFVSEEAVEVLTNGDPRVVDELTRQTRAGAPLWCPVANGYLIHDFADYQMTAERAEADRQRTRDAMRDARVRAVSTAPPVPKSEFQRPKPGDVMQYASEIGMDRIEAEKFYDYEQSKGWRVGIVAMKDWKAALRNWNRNAHNRFRRDSSRRMADVVAEIEQQLNGGLGG